MKRKSMIIAGVSAALLLCVIGVAQAFAAGVAPATSETGPPGGQPVVEMGQMYGGMSEAMGEMFEGMHDVTGEMFGGMYDVTGEMFGGMHYALREWPEGMSEVRVGWGCELSDEDRAKMEAAWAEREGKLQSFIESLTDEQKTAFEELFGAEKHVFGVAGDEESGFMGKPQLRQRGEGGMEAPNMPRGLHRELTDEQRAQMEEMRIQQEEKLESFLQTLTDGQKALYEAMTPKTIKPPDGQLPAMIDEATITAMKEACDAFNASLTEEQKALYEEVMNGLHFSIKLPAEPADDFESNNGRFGKNKNSQSMENLGVAVQSITL